MKSKASRGRPRHTAANGFQFTEDHRRWAGARQRTYGGSTADYLEIIAKQHGKCALSGVPLLFDACEGGGWVRGGPGCHPLYAALDHCAPGSACHGLQIVCYALNDLKGHLPLACFTALSRTSAWRRLMKAWRRQQRQDASDREAFQDLLKSPETRSPRYSSVKTTRTSS